jgi:hypothetical protein
VSELGVAWQLDYAKMNVNLAFVEVELLVREFVRVDVL